MYEINIQVYTLANNYFKCEVEKPVTSSPEAALIGLGTTDPREAVLGLAERHHTPSKYRRVIGR